MVKIEELPSLKSVADVIITESRAGQVIIFSFPTAEVWGRWRHFFLESLRNRLVELGEEPFWDVLIAVNDSSSPQKDIADFLGISSPLDQAAILNAGVNDPPLIIELSCDGSIGVAWQRFIKDTGRFFRVYDSCGSSRVICIFLIAPDEIPPIQVDVGLRCYAFWNPLRWEEVRMIVAASLSKEENVLVRAWQICTYAGAANADPKVIDGLARSSPGSLAEIKSVIVTGREQLRSPIVDNHYVGHFFAEKQWDVPVGMTKAWLLGALWGYTLDRGALIPWDQVADSDLDQVISRTIWREQVAGLYPLLMEITVFTSEIITIIRGPHWQKYLVSSEIDRAATEPGSIITIFRENRELRKLPEKIYKLLLQLRAVRNKLAHLDPVELNDVQKIWSLFNHVSKLV